VWNDDGLDTTYVDVLNDPIKLFYDTQSIRRGGRFGGEDDFGAEIEEALSPVRSFDLEVVGILEHVEDVWGGRGGNDAIYKSFPRGGGAQARTGRRRLVDGCFNFLRYSR
jgi:hypothetical protein